MEHTLTIKKVIAGGKGLATLADGMVVMVAGVLPGETVTVCETKVHRGFMEAGLVRIEAASPERVVPPCPYYGSCGGCDLQHGSYPAQLRIKAGILRESLERARLELPPEQPTLPSPRPFGYRSRVRLHLDRAGRLGFHATASNTVVPIRRCLLAVDPINRVIAALADHGWSRQLAERIAAIELIHSPADDRVVLVLQPRPGQRASLAADLTASLRPLADEVILETPGRRPDLVPPVPLSQSFTLLGRTYRLAWDHRCFFQVNSEQNPRLIALALDCLPPSPSSTVLDLFCGMGNFSIPLAMRGMAVTGVEHNGRSIRWAKENSRANGLTARFLAADVEQQLQALVAAQARFDAVLLDPPRQGLGKDAALLPLLHPAHILSVSCDPATLARDLAVIVKGGYRLTRLVPVDMFPQTHHLESVALLERI